MENHYFIGEGPEAEKIISETLAREGIFKNVLQKITADYGAVGLIFEGWNNERFVGLFLLKRRTLIF